jgi:hypothetical protein
MELLIFEAGVFSMIRETTVFKEWLEQRYNEGRIEGEISGQRRLLQKQLEKKFGLLSPGIKERLHWINNEALDLLAVALLDLATVDDLHDWFANISSNYIYSSFQVSVNGRILAAIVHNRD